MPPDNATTVAPGADVEFPRDGSTGGTSITRLGADSFRLGEPGTYLVWYQVNVNQAGQLVLTLDGAELPATVIGRATGSSSIAGMMIVTTTSENAVLTVRNPADNASALIITPTAGGTQASSAHLVILQLS